MAASPGPNSAPTLTTLDTTKTDIKTSSKIQFVASSNSMASENESTIFGSLTSPNSGSNNQMDLTPNTVGFDIPQWKKDLIQRRKINIAKTIAAASGNSLREDTTSFASGAGSGSSNTSSTSTDLKNCSTLSNNNNTDRTTNSQRTNTSDEFNRSNTSHIPITSSSSYSSTSSSSGIKSIEKMPKTPTTTTTATTQQPQIKLEMLRGGHYTHFNKKSSEGFLNNHNEKLLDTSAYTSSSSTISSSLQTATENQQQPQALEQNISSLAQENLRFRKNLNSEQQQQLPESPNTTSSDSLLTLISDSSIKAAAAAESYKNQNKNNNCRNNSMCASDEHSHIFQTEPALTTTTTNINKSNTNTINNKLLNDHEEDDCDDDDDDNNDQLQHELQFVSECDRVNLACGELNNAKQIDSKVLHSTKSDSKLNNTGYSSSSSSVHSITTNTTTLANNNINNNKKACGIVNTSSSSSSSALPSSNTANATSLTFKKNPHIGYVNDVTTHHNLKINSKLRSNQNSCLSTTPINIETTNSNESSSPSSLSSTKVTNNKKKMVAVHQEKNDITNTELDFDPSEELQYGPGIVSKLRCRYLSLALRQTMDKQRSPIDYLRRATSLNNLLDGNNIHEDDEDDDDDDDEENNDAPTSQTTNKEKMNPSSAASSSSQTINTTSSSLTTNKNKTVSVVVDEKRYNNNNTNKSNLDSHPKMEDSIIRSYKNRSRHVKRGNDSLKRARSVEALLCEKSPWNFCNSQPTPIGNNNVSSDMVTIDDKINNARERLLSGSENSPPKRLTSIIDDTERPPPDLVKQTLKIFEASANRRAGNVIRNGGAGEVATKVANYKCLMTQNKPATIGGFSKPVVVSPKQQQQHKPKPIITDIKNTINNNSSSSSPTTTTTSSSSSHNNIIVSSSSVQQIQSAEKIVSKTLNGHINTKVPATSSSPASSSSSSSSSVTRPKMDSTSIRNNIGCASSAVVEVLSAENSSEMIQSQKKIIAKPAAVDLSPSISEEIKHEIRKQENPFPESSEPESEENDDDDDDDDSMDGEYVINKDESQDAAAAISKGPGTSQNFAFPSISASSSSSSLKKSEREPLHDIPTLASSSSATTTTTVKQIGVIRPLLAERSPPINQIMNNFAEEIPYEKSSSTTTSTTTLTSREIEKNRINNEKKIKKDLNEVTSSLNKINVQTTSSSSSNSDDNSSSQISSSTGSSVLISKKKRLGSANVPENNTMVFNFKDRKEVPDYIESDGLIFKHKRELPKPNEPGFVLLGDLSRETSTDPEDEWPMCPPSPCDVEFENANIVIDGKSNIKTRSKEANFRVQFNDTLNSTFEYPSESSLIEDTGSSAYADLNSYDVEENDSPIVHHHVKSEEIIQLPPMKTILGNMPLGSAPLGCYTPLTAKTDNLFQLGVTRIPNAHSDKNGNEKSSSGDLYAEHDKPLMSEYLKPASDDLTIVYSEGSHKTDLLY